VQERSIDVDFENIGGESGVRPAAKIRAVSLLPLDSTIGLCCRDRMGALDPSGTDWSDREIDLIVADYFEMLALELAGKEFVKAHRNALLQAATGRSRGSIEFKHQNISAVLAKLGLPWIIGYKPMTNFQGALIDGVERALSMKDGQESLLSPAAALRSVGFGERADLFVEAPPQLSKSELDVPAPLKRLVKKFDPAARDARNRSLGRNGEELVLTHERERLARVGRDDLARKIRWVSEEDGDGDGYDIASFEPDGRERLIEVKTTVGCVTTPFFISENERAFSAERPDAFRLMRVYDFVRTPRAFELAPPLDVCLLLRPAVWRAGFGE